MTTFAVASDNLHGRPVRVGWSDDQFWGNVDAVTAVLSMARQLEGTPVVTSAGVTEHDHLSNADSACSIIMMVLGPDAQFIPRTDPPKDRWDISG